MLYKILKPIAVALMRWWLGLQVRGAEHVPGAGPVLMVSNHQSVLDPPIIGSSTSRTLHFMAKVELFRIPGFGWLIGPFVTSIPKESLENTLSSTRSAALARIATARKP